MTFYANELRWSTFEFWCMIKTVSSLYPRNMRDEDLWETARPTERGLITGITGIAAHGRCSPRAGPNRWSGKTRGFSCSYEPTGWTIKKTAVPSGRIRYEKSIYGNTNNCELRIFLPQTQTGADFCPAGVAGQKKPSLRETNAKEKKKHGYR